MSRSPRPPLAVFTALAALVVVGALAAPARADLPALIPREILFGNPERVSPRLSLDGKRLAWLAPDKSGVMQVWLGSIGRSAKVFERVLTADKKRPIRSFRFAADNRTLLYSQDADGDENFHVFGVDLESGAVRDYTPWQGVRAAILAVEHKHMGEILVSVNVRDRRLMDVWRIDLRTGATALDTENPGDVAGWIADADLVVRGAQVITPDGGTELRVRDGAKAPWRTLAKVGPEENLDLEGFSLDGKKVFLTSSIGSDTARLVERDLAGGAEKAIAGSPAADVGEVMIHPESHHVEAVAVDASRREWTVIDPKIKDDFAGIAKLSGGDFFVLSRDFFDKTWIVAFTEDRGPIRFFAWDRAAKKGELLFTHQPRLEGLPLAAMKPVTIAARDGLKLPAYLTLPVGVPAKKLPLVLFVHGGPWARDMWGYNANVQWLANRGYAVLQVNFRGSTGFGKKFLHAADRQWGKAMHDDLIDAVKWAVKDGIADPKRVALMGGSYGGYAALAAAAFTPDAFKCAVDIVGPSSLFTLLKSIPPYWAPLLAMFKQRVGDIDNPKDEPLLRAASPLFSADKIKIPLLIGQGANDPRVKQAESEQIVAAIEKNRGRATYVLYPDEGHGFARPENRVDFNARAEAFLAAELGGRAEPMTGDRIPGSTAVVREIGRK